VPILEDALPAGDSVSATTSRIPSQKGTSEMNAEVQPAATDRHPRGPNAARADGVDSCAAALTRTSASRSDGTGSGAGRTAQNWSRHTTKRGHRSDTDSVGADPPQTAKPGVGGGSRTSTPHASLVGEFAL
jgi:hypothetical protein